MMDECHGCPIGSGVDRFGFSVCVCCHSTGSSITASPPFALTCPSATQHSIRPPSSRRFILTSPSSSPVINNHHPTRHSAPYPSACVHRSLPDPATLPFTPPNDACTGGGHACYFSAAEQNRCGARTRNHRKRAPPALIGQRAVPRQVPVTRVTRHTQRERGSESAGPLRNGERRESKGWGSEDPWVGVCQPPSTPLGSRENPRRGRAGRLKSQLPPACLGRVDCVVSVCCVVPPRTEQQRSRACGSAGADLVANSSGAIFIIVSWAGSRHRRRGLGRSWEFVGGQVGG